MIMTPSEALHQHRDAVLAIALGNGAKNVRVFGSVLHGKDKDSSDLDLLVDVAADTTLLDMALLQLAIEKQLGASVDIVTPEDISHNFRQRILDAARPI
jgi:predicted nucleotidyltransferase